MSATATRSYTRLAIAIVVAALVVGASVVGASYLQATTTTSVSTSTVTTTSRSTTTFTTTKNDTVTEISQVSFTELASNSSDPLCGTVFQKGLDLFGQAPANSTYGNSQERLFSMPTNATATICVSFNGLMPANSSNSPAPGNFPGQVDSPNIMYVTGGYYVNSDNPAAGIMDTGQAHLLTIGNATYPVIIYTITTSPGATGVYNLSYEYQCPPWIPITVGYSTAQAQGVIGESYHVFLESSGCVDRGGQPNGIIIGIGGNIDVDWVMKS